MIGCFDVRVLLSKRLSQSSSEELMQLLMPFSSCKPVTWELKIVIFYIVERNVVKLDRY